MIAKILTFCRNLWTLLIPYWKSEERWVSGALIGGVLGLSIGGIYLSVLMNDWQRLFYNSFQNVDYAEFIHQLIRYFFLSVISMLVNTYRSYFRQIVEIRWRRWLSKRYSDSWLKEQAYYRMRFAAVAADNPDQRIAEDLKKFPIQTISIIFGFIQAMGSLGAFAAILWDLSSIYKFGEVQIPGFILWVVLLYSIAGTWLTHLIGKPLIRFDREQQQYEADYRFALVRLRENAEEIAASQGEEQEIQNLNGRFAKIATNWFNIIRRGKLLSYFDFGYGKVTDIVPYLVIAPLFFTGAIQLGEMMQTKNAFGRVAGSFSWFVYRYETLAEWKATVDRLIGFEQALSEVAATLPAGLTRQEVTGDGIHLEQFSLYQPDNTEILQDITLHFPPRSRTLISGPSGCGKTTFFRAINGLWPYCSGTMKLPASTRMMYLPQRAYLPIGALRQAVTYPEPVEIYSNELVGQTLADCGLSRLRSRLDEECQWDQELSPGEQQRLAFVRALLLKPQWIFLDEATSALDELSEARLYQLLTERLPDTAIISIAHKSSLMQFHDQRLDFGKIGDGFSICAKK